MARVNVETRALAETRFYNLSQELEASRIETIGLLVIFWHDSQERKVWSGTRDEIIKLIPWGGLKEAEGVFDLLVKHDYISPSENDQFIIRGNKKHIDALEEKQLSGIKGGIASGEARRKKTNKSNETKHLLQPGEPPASPSEPNSIQYKAIQSNSKQNINTKENILTEKPSVENLSIGTKECIDEWKACLEFHGAAQGFLAHHETEIARAIQRWGNKNVLTAILGLRNEPAFEGYNPKTNVTLKRLFNPEKFDRFVLIGAQIHQKHKLKIAAAAELSAVRSKAPRIDDPPNEISVELSDEEIAANLKRIKELQKKAFA